MKILKAILFSVVLISLAGCFGSDQLPPVQPTPTDIPLSGTDEPVVVNSTSTPTATPTTIESSPLPTPTPTPVPRAWQHLGDIRGGNVTQVVVSPDYAVDQTAFAAINGQGVYRTTNGGQAWQRMTPEQETQETYVDCVIEHLAISPDYAQDQTLFVSTFCIRNGGNANIYRSGDGGESWQTMVLPNADSAAAFNWMLSPEGFIYLASFGVPYRSTNGGQSFMAMSSLKYGSEWLELKTFSPTFVQDRTMLATGSRDKFFLSTDAGQTWSPFGETFPRKVDFIMSANFSEDGLMLALTKDYDKENKITVPSLYRSTNGGDTWSKVEQLPPDFSKLLRWSDYWFTFSPQFAVDQTIFAGSPSVNVIYSSTDAGQTWEPLDVGLSTGAKGLTLSPNFRQDGVAFLAHPLGVYQISGGIIEGNRHWVNNGLPRVAPVKLVFNPANPDEIFAAGSFYRGIGYMGSPDWDSGIYSSNDGGHTWQPMRYFYGYIKSLTLSSNYAVDKTIVVYKETYSKGGPYRYLYHSGDGGRTWESKDLRGLLCPTNPDSDVVSFFPADDQTVSGFEPLVDDGRICHLILSPDYTNDGTTFAYGHNRLLRSTDRAHTWTSVLGGPEVSNHIQGLALSPQFATDHTAYTTFDGKFYRSTDAGVTWQPVTTDLPGLPGNLMFGPTGDLYASIAENFSTGRGVYRSTDGEHWKPVGDFPADLLVRKLQWQQKGDQHDQWTLYALTDKGLWVY